MSVASNINNLEQTVESLARFPEENPNPVMRVSPDGRLLYANSASQVILDYWGIDISESFPSHLTDEIKNIYENGQASLLEEAFGSAIFTLNFSPIRNAGYLNVYGTDITKTHEMREARDTAKEADRAKSEFLANMSHEIRTPMNGIMGMAELLSNTSLSSKQKMFTNVIVNSSSALLTIINDILDFSKIDAGKFELNMAPFSLRDAIEDVATLLSSNIRDKNLELIVRIDPDLPAIFLGDAGRIRQVITNIMGNAVKFTDEGHVLLDVSGHPHGEIYNLIFSVSDTGIGIPEDQQVNIFEKFQQVDGSATRKHEGTGLGLAIASSLIAMMEGDITVESSLGQGSTFTFDMRLAQHGEKQPSKPLPVDVSGARIIVVDDNPVNLEILKEQLTAWNFKPTICTSGEKALTLMGSAREMEISIDLVILDYQMPEMTGADVLREMRNNADIAHIPAIILSSVDTSEYKQSMVGLEVQGQLTKPARSNLLYESILNALQRVCETDSGSSESSVELIEKPLETTKTELVNKSHESSIQSNAISKICTDTPRSKEGSIDILIAEDNETNQTVLKMAFADTEYTFHIEENGKDAVEFFETHKPKLILMDVSMPVMNGLDATKAVRAIEETSDEHTPIIGVTAHALSGDMEKCLDAGMDDYLPKPISPNMLTNKIAEWLEGAPEQKLSVE